MMSPPVPVTAPVAAPVATAPVPALQAVPHEVVAAIDVFAQYEDVVRNCGPVSVYVERKGAQPGVWLLDHYPQNGPELYAALRHLHGQSLSSEYELRFRSGGDQRGSGHVTLPHVPATLPQQVPPPQQYVQPPPQQLQYAAPAQQYAPPQPPPPAPPQQTSPADQYAAFYAMQRQQLELLQEMQRTAAAGQQIPPPPPLPPPAQPVMQPPPVAPPPSGTPADQYAAFYAMQRQQLELLQEMQRTAAAGQQIPPPPPLPPPAQPVMQPPPVAPPPSGTPADQYAAFYAMQRQQLELLQEMQRTAAAGQQQPHVQTQPVAQPQQQPQRPQGPPGTVWVADLQQFVRLDVLYQAMTGERPSGASGHRAPPGPSSPYYGGDAPPPDPAQPTYGRSAHAPPVQQPQREKTPMEVMREAITLTQTLVSMADQVRPPQQAVAAPEPEEPDDDSPVRVVDLGGAKGVFNVSDGSTRFMESIIANVPGVFKAAGEAWESARKARAEEEARRQQQKPQLPPGFVEVGPGYVPPEGFVAIPVGHVPQQAQPVQQAAPVQYAQPVVQAAPVMPVQQAAPVVLPDPPANMPLPIVETPEQQPWQPPSFVPGGGG